MLDVRLRKFYSKYSNEYIKNNIGRPQIRIIFKRDESHPNYKFKYYGAFEFCETNLDEHVISTDYFVDFDDNLNFHNVSLNG